MLNPSNRRLGESQILDRCCGEEKKSLPLPEIKL
jgi:hypothetical protein